MAEASGADGKGTALRARIPGCDAEISLRLPDGFRAVVSGRELALEDSLKHPRFSHAIPIGDAPASRLFSDAWEAGNGAPYIHVFQRIDPADFPVRDGLDTEWTRFRSLVLKQKVISAEKMERLLIRLGIDRAARQGLLRVNREDGRGFLYLSESRGMMLACKERLSDTCGGIAMCYSVPKSSARKMARFLLQADFE
jgi:hypothetical protein